MVAQAREVTTDRLLSLTVWGIMLGGIIALGSIGLTLVYGVLKFPNFSHGALVTIGAYAAFAFMPLLPQGAALGPFSFGWELLMSLVLAMPVVGVVAVAVDRAIYRRLRLRKASLVLFAMASLGMAFFLRSIVYLIFGSDFHFYYLGRANPALHLPFGVRVQADQLFILGLAFFLVFLIYLLLEKTKMGKAMRATADNPELAQVRGINTEQVIAWTWMIGGALAAAGGVMYGLSSQLRPEMGFWLLLPMFAAVIMGGIGNPYGALAGALIIGVAQQVSTAFLNPAYGPGVAFALMVLTLVLRPQGLFGREGG
ncbi:MAG: branched-chain amino acid ABC transporter permease [Gammaproteobacteria bacterium]|nr:branched-chain amino acid ABC transporter permease [Gammaproteobacteria bacterium]NIR82795.1 branched-chain amino acid ABC transporter permease [Gammaproteobacteria bacterium]NIR89904.1 branched-chain amino acid ABC transporter permease [Gammaproteobacteria bacterium]NIU03953.1 branched-chain amino acid ABC transporter permease [Gammaproteobacteria bacterium]NIV51273.1 branched-chain amino acid ABC transporter permease [Gammaproteobacteria bacterium]